MNFNGFLWQNFVESSRGREWLSFFDSLPAQFDTPTERLRSFLAHWTNAGMIQERHSVDAEIEGVRWARRELAEAEKQNLLPASPMGSLKDAESYFCEGVAGLAYADDSEGESAREGNFVFAVSDVPQLSVALFCAHPQYFFPYFFYPQFHVLKRIFEEFGIFLPPVPAKRDSDARFRYYFELCRSLHGFAHRHGIPFQAMPAFLYGFAPELLPPEAGTRAVGELPTARRAWFVGGGIDSNGDFEYLDRIGEDSRTIWQGSPETLPGDIVVMYCLSPRSCIHSVWRALRAGSAEPFRHFYHTIWIGYPQLVPPVSLAELRSDTILSEMPLVRANMQGINGRPIGKKYFDRLVDLWVSRGADSARMPMLGELDLEAAGLRTERDVECQLLEPLLEELGFGANDWVRQLPLRVGRREKVIPDYVILPSVPADGHGHRAVWVWEAKLSISSHRQLRVDFGQAVSYARLLGARGLCLISREGVWLALLTDDFTLDKARHWSLAQVRQPDNLSELRGIAGKRALTKH